MIESVLRGSACVEGRPSTAHTGVSWIISGQRRRSANCSPNRTPDRRRTATTGEDVPVEFEAHAGNHGLPALSAELLVVEPDRRGDIEERGLAFRSDRREHRLRLGVGM